MVSSVSKRAVCGVAVASLLMVGALMVWLPSPTDAATTRSLVINNALVSSQVPFQTFDGNPPKVYDINGDGQLEIIAQNDNQWFYVFDSKTGALLFEAKTRFPHAWSRSFNGPEVSIMNSDGVVRIIVANSAAVVSSYRYDHAGSTSSAMKFVFEWDRRMEECHTQPSMDSKPVLVDLDKDGDFEILAATEEQGLYALHHDGSLMWKNCLGGGNAEPGVADLNLDGWPDVVHVSDGGVVAALNGRTGGWMWAYNTLQHHDLGSASIPVGPGIGQLDGLGGPDVVVGVRDSHDATNFANNDAMLLALDSNGKLLWARQDANGGNPLTYTHPVVVDAAGDGTNEVYWADWNTMGHKPPWNDAEAWQVTGPGNFYRYSNTGQLVWKQTLGTYWSNKDLAIADVDGDGVQEVLANGPNGPYDGIWYLDSRNGAKESFVSTDPYNVARGPIVADLWNTGKMQWLVPGGPSDGGSSGAILVFDTGVAYNSVHPHLPYRTLGPALPTAEGCFPASFRVNSPNEWWQEVYVDPVSPRTITGADVRINGGAWEAMAKNAWDGWTISRNAPAGTPVEFRVMDQNRQVSQSQVFTWMNGQNTKESVPCSSTPPPTSTTPPPTTTPSGFSAQYTLGSANEWWVEVKVNANQPLASVDARANNGAWTSLSSTSWGTWAKSFFVAKCSAVQFRATSTSTAQHLSQTFTWLNDGSCGTQPTTFTATFRPEAIGNDWWVQTSVTANKPVATVSASINGGAWIPLSKQDWGSWAKSIHAPDGSQVRFQATDGAGGTVTSGTTVWT